jgi:two-component system, sensor histidine kinase and response regulator
MKAELDRTADEVGYLKACLNDLACIVGLPAMCSGGEPAQIVRTVLDALLEILRLDLLHVQLNEPVGEAPTEMGRVAFSRSPAGQLDEIGEVLDRLLGDDPEKWPARAPVQSPLGDGEIFVVPVPLGMQGAIGALVAGSRRVDFPTQTERLLLNVAANQAAIWLQEERRLREQKRAKELLELGVRGSNHCIFDFDIKDGKIENSPVSLVNFWEPLGYDPAAMPATFAATARMVLHPDEVAHVAAEMQGYLDGTKPWFELEHRVRHRDGSWHWRLARGVALRQADGTPRRLIGTSVDITGLKRIEDELQRAREVAESANRAKDEFLANVSHEIRTPMNAILGLTELAMDSAATEHQRQLLGTVKSAARNLLGIINDLLDFSKIEAGRMALDLAHFGLRAAVGDTLRALAARAHRKGLELICHVRSDVPDALIGDSSRLRQVILNLVGNAIKFTPLGEVMVEVATVAEAVAADTVLLRFTVRDTGIGIAREKQAAIFRAFEQEDSTTTRRYGGTGLGLTISAQLADLMGGSIVVDSQPGRGSTFTFTARFARSSVPATGARRVPHEPLEHLGVLVVDDNESNRRILVEWLTGWRLRPVAVEDAASALDALAAAERSGAPPALVLLDSRLPDGDGLWLAAEIRKRSGTSMRLVLLSSEDTPDLLARSREAGIQAYLLKPVQQSELLETLAAVMSAPDATPDAATGRNGGSSPPVASTGGGLHILVAEDNELNVIVLRELIRERGHRAHIVGDGRAALAAATDDTFDLLLLDLHMPEMDGFEVVRAIRQRERATGRHVPVVALTARSASGDRVRCLAAGMDAFLSKPVHKDELWAAVGRVTAAIAEATVTTSRLLDSAAAWRACGGKASILDKLCEAFRRSLPDHLACCRSALGAGDLGRLGEAAHMLCGTLGAFSTVAGAVASTLEDSAVRGERESCQALLGRLEEMSAELLENMRALTIESIS